MKEEIFWYFCGIIMGAILFSLFGKYLTFTITSADINAMNKLVHLSLYIAGLMLFYYVPCLICSIPPIRRKIEQRYNEKMMRK